MSKTAKDWKSYRLDEITSLITDFTANGSFKDLKDNVVYCYQPDYARLIRTTDLQARLSNDGVYVDKKSYDFLKKSSVGFGDILFSNVGSIGLSFIYKKKAGLATLGPNMFLVRANEKVESDYLFQYFNLDEFQKVVRLSSSTTSMPLLNKTNFRALEISLPSLKEQKKIAEVLTSVDRVIELTSMEIDKLKDLKKGMMQELLENEKTGKVLTIQEICSLVTDGKHGDCENQQGSGYYFLSSKDIINGTLNFDGAREITKKDFDETHRRTNMCPGDILITSTGANIGKLGIAPVHPRTTRTTLQKSVAIVKPIPEKVNNRYLMYSLMLKLSTIQDVSSGSAQKNLLLKDLREIQILVPSLNEQEKIVEQLGSIDKKISISSLKLSSLAHLKKGLMTDLLTGKVRVNV